MKTVTRTYDGDVTIAGVPNFVEVTNDMPDSVEISFNAKGKMQHSIKMYFASVDGIMGVVNRLADMDEKIRLVFAGKLAGEE